MKGYVNCNRRQNKSATHNPEYFPFNIAIFETCKLFIY